MKRRKFTRDFKLAVLAEHESGKSSAQIGREYNIHPTMVFKWKQQLERYQNNAFRGNGNAYTLEAKLAERDRLIGKLYAEKELLKKALSALEARVTELRKKGGNV